MTGVALPVLYIPQNEIPNARICLLHHPTGSVHQSQRALTARFEDLDLFTTDGVVLSVEVGLVCVWFSLVDLY